MKAAERGEVTKVGHPENLLKSLNEPRDGNERRAAMCGHIEDELPF
jgi:hypothetical protein